MKTKKETQNIIKEIKESMKHLDTLKEYKFEIIKNEYSYDILITNPKFKTFYGVIFERLNKMRLIFYVQSNKILIYNSTLRGDSE